MSRGSFSFESLFSTRTPLGSVGGYVYTARRPSGRLVATIATILVLIDAIRLVVLPGRYQPIFMNGFELVVVGLGAVCCAVAAARSSAFSKGQWVLVAAFFLATALADAHDLVVDLFPRAEALLPEPLVFVGWFTYLPLALLVFFPLREGSRSPWTWLSALDFLQVALVLAVAFFHYVYLPHITANRPWAFRIRPDDVRNAILAVGLLLRALIDPSPRAQAFYRIVAGTFAALTVIVLFRQPDFIDIHILGRPVCLIVLGVLAMRWEDVPDPAPALEGRGIAFSWALALVPSLGPVLVMVPVLAGQTPSPNLLAMEVVIGVSIAIFIARTGLAEHHRQASVRALRLSEERYRLLFERNLAGVFRSTLDGRMLDCNDAFARTFGFASREEVLAGSIVEVYETPLQRVEFLAQLQRTGHLRNHESKLKRRDGKTIWTLQSVSLAGSVVEGTLIDVTEHKLLEEQLRQAQKMEAVGRLAGGVAHDFNNVLSVVLGYSELLLGELPAGDPKVEHVAEIQRAAERAVTLTRQLLVFSRKQVLQPKVLDLNAVLSGMEKMLRRLIGEDVDIRVLPGSELWQVKADPGQLEQVILNLALNARDAMPHGGTLTLETTNLEVGETHVESSAVVTPGLYVVLSVRDTGHGMDAAVKRRIFEPFFTTKELGKGTGLGLATVYGILEQSGGHIEVESEPGMGSTFKIYLPRVEERSAAPTIL
jgi:PAS domain S-box-containing protein